MEDAISSIISGGSGVPKTDMTYMAMALAGSAKRIPLRFGRSGTKIIATYTDTPITNAATPPARLARFYQRPATTGTKRPALKAPMASV